MTENFIAGKGKTQSLLKENGVAHQHEKKLFPKEKWNRSEVN